MAADTGKAKLAIEAIREYLAESELPCAQGDHPSAPDGSLLDLIETYEWLLERRDHLAVDHEALKREHATMTDWTSEQIGALMIAATQAIDCVESMWTGENSGPLPPSLAAQVASWRAAVGRYDTLTPAPAGAGLGAP
jgi:hypothetical protein